jgi:uncharacterized membrane protein YdbT with pleckstrin-like domain
MEEQTLWRGKPFYFGLPSFTDYHVTNQRLIVESGIFTKRTREMELFRIRDVSVKRNVIERLFKFGDITLATTDSTNPTLVLKNIKRSQEVKDVIRAAVREQRNTQKLEFPEH